MNPRKFHLVVASLIEITNNFIRFQNSEVSYKTDPWKLKPEIYTEGLVESLILSGIR